MTIAQNYIRNLTGPTVQEDGVELENRRPINNYQSGFTVTDDPVNNRLNISLNATELALATGLSGSAGGVTFRSDLVPQLVLTGTISSGSQVAITASMSENTHFMSTCRVTVRHPITKFVVYTKALANHSTYVSGSSVQADFVNTVDDNFFAVSMQLSSSTNATGIVYSLTSGTGSSYPYTLLMGASSYSF